MNLTKYSQEFPKNYLTVTIHNELGEELMNELEQAGCYLMIVESLDDYYFKNITPELLSKVDKKRKKSSIQQRF